MKPIFAEMIQKYGAQESTFKTKTDWDSFVQQKASQLSTQEKKAFRIVSENFDALSKMDDREGLALSDFTLMDKYQGTYQKTVSLLLKESEDNLDNLPVIATHNMLREECDLNKISQLDEFGKDVVTDIGLLILSARGATVEETFNAVALHVNKNNSEADYLKWNTAHSEKFSTFALKDGDPLLTRSDLLFADLAAYKKP